MSSCQERYGGLVDAADQNSQAELEKARFILTQLQLPPEVTNIELRTGPDLYGNTSLWVDLHVRSDVQLDRETVRRLTNFGDDVQSRVIDGGVSLSSHLLR